MPATQMLAAPRWTSIATTDAAPSPPLACPPSATSTRPAAPATPAATTPTRGLRRRRNHAAVPTTSPMSTRPRRSCPGRVPMRNPAGSMPGADPDTQGEEQAGHARGEQRERLGGHDPPGQEPRGNEDGHGDHGEPEGQHEPEVGDGPRLDLDQRRPAPVVPVVARRAGQPERHPGRVDRPNAEGDEAARLVAVGGRQRPPVEGERPVRELGQRHDQDPWVVRRHGAGVRQDGHARRVEEVGGRVPRIEDLAEDQPDLGRGDLEDLAGAGRAAEKLRRARARSSRPARSRSGRPRIPAAATSATRRRRMSGAARGASAIADRDEAERRPRRRRGRSRAGAARRRRRPAGPGRPRRPARGTGPGTARPPCPGPR